MIYAEFLEAPKYWKIIEKGNIYVDRPENQKNNYQHGMRDVGQTKAEARFKSLKFQTEQLNKAVKLFKEGKLEKAFFELGQGLHSIQDEVAHEFITLPGHANPEKIYRDVKPTAKQIGDAYMRTVHYIKRFLKRINNKKYETFKNN